MLQDRPQMLQDNKTRADIDDIQPLIPQEEGLAEFVYWAIGILRRQYLVILFVAALGLGSWGHLSRRRDTNLYGANKRLH